MLSADAPDPCPQYFELLSEQDRKGYNFLRKTLSSPSCKNLRNRSTETFNDIIDGIKAFVVRNDEDDLKRSLVVGLVWMEEDTIAINTRQLRLLLSKCKSSINGSFQNLGYIAVPTGVDSTKGNLLKVFPHLEKNFKEHRQWTVRQLSKNEPAPSKLSEIIKANLANPTNYVTPPQIPEEEAEGLSIGTKSGTISLIGNNAPKSQNGASIGSLFSDDPLSFENDEFVNLGWDFGDMF